MGIDTLLEMVQLVADMKELKANPDRLAKTADRFGIERRYTDVDSMLADNPDLDAADVCVWNCNHAECSIKALNAGLHVLCEKPMAYSAKEAEEMKAAAEQFGQFVKMKNHERKVKKLLNEKNI